MKTMTCSDLGGLCGTEHAGADVNEVIIAQDRHLKDAVADGRTDHEPAHAQMQGRWKRPVSGLTWYFGVKREFAARPEVDGGS